MKKYYVQKAETKLTENDCERFSKLLKEYTGDDVYETSDADKADYILIYGKTPEGHIYIRFEK